MEGIERSFADLEYESKKGKTRRERFLERMEVLAPWEKLLEQIRPYYPTAGKGRVPYPLEGMLRVHCVQLFYNVSDPAMEDMLYEIESVRRFTGIRLEKALDKTTILTFRHLLERHGLGKVLFETIKEHLTEAGLVLKEGTIMDAGISASPASRKNRKRARDPEIKQTRKGNQWRFGMKLHIGVDDQTGVAHSLATTANVHDLAPSEELLHGEEERVWGDAGYQGIEKGEEHKDRQVAWHVAMRPGQRRKLAREPVEKLMEECKSSVRAKVEHLFFYVKQMFGYKNTRYRCLAKNENQLALLLGFANLLRGESCLV
ncbi:MAG: IS5 family transposase [Cyanobacteria bacterium MAG CAR3_bin_5]|nr:IS5 family transposase [Cyanobacteria bacterium MAG CAR3_bin_5]